MPSLKRPKNHDLPDFLALYETSVQSPAYHVELYESFYRTLRGSRPLLLREDFSGTFALSAEWVRSHTKRRALAIDLDSHALESGHTRHWLPLKAAQRKRLKWLKTDVRIATRPAADLIVVGNFSHFVLRTRGELLKYLRAARASLVRKKGVLLLETPGGPGFVCSTRERERFKWGGRRWLYTWEQREFNPISNEGRYAIHFKDLRTGKRYPNAFEYHWRVWSLPELRDAMKEAGFSETQVFWETVHKGNATGEYLSSESGENSFNWIAYVAGLA